MLELYRDLVALYEKTHAAHIRTVNMPGTATLHPTLGAHYETLQDMVDTVGEDIIVKAMKKPLPSPMECLKKSTIDTEAEHADAEETASDLYKDYEYLSASFRDAATGEKNLLVQNILLNLWDASTKLCADMAREICEEEGEESEPEEPKKEPKGNGIKAY